MCTLLLCESSYKRCYCIVLLFRTFVIVVMNELFPQIMDLHGWLRHIESTDTRLLKLTHYTLKSL